MKRKQPVWLLRETITTLHEQLLAAFGGPSGIRDDGLLESALARPENRFAYERPDVFELAADYAFGLVKNHPFVDGNKRVAFATCVVILEINGYRFGASEADAVVQTLALASGAIDQSAFARWLERHSKRVKT